MLLRILIIIGFTGIFLTEIICQDFSKNSDSLYLKDIHNYDSLTKILDDLGVSADEMKNKAKEVFSEIGWDLMLKRKKLQFYNEGFEMNTVYIDNDHINYIEGGVFSNIAMRNKLEIMGLPISVDNRLIHSYSLNNSPNVQIFTNVNVDLKEFRNNQIKNKLNKGNPRDYFRENPFNNELKTFLLSENIEQILTDNDILETEKKYNKFLDSLGIYKDSLTGMRNVLNDSISDISSTIHNANRFLNALIKLRAVYEDTYHLKNKYYNQLQSKVGEAKNFDLTDLKNEFENDSRDTLNKFMSSKSTGFKNFQSILDVVEMINYGFQTVYISDYTLAGVPLQGLQVLGGMDNTEVRLFTGKVLGRRNQLLSFDPLLNNQSVLGRIHLVQITKEYSKDFKNDLIFQFQEGDPSKKEIEGGRKVTIASITSAEFLEKFLWKSEISSQYNVENDFSGYKKSLIHNSAFKMNLACSVLKELKFYSQIEYIGRDFSTIGNPFLINNRIISEVGTEYDKKNLNVSIGWQTWKSLPDISIASQSMQKRFVIDAKYRIKEFQISATYRPVSIINNVNAVNLGNSQAFEINMYNLGVKYSSRSNENSRLFVQTLNLTNLKTNLSLSDTLLRTDLNYLVSNTIKQLGNNNMISLIVSLGVESGVQVRDLNIDLSFNHTGKNSDLRYSLQYIKFPDQQPFGGGQFHFNKNLGEQIGLSVMIQALHPTDTNFSFDRFRKTGSLGINYKII